ncbi:MAG: hypothetical protein HC770_06090 [Pseudanabaena sp. CRU_2_10]|nr:hypothetical protein [Pseudanabaena sp. CRU_2_10]
MSIDVIASNRLSGSLFRNENCQSDEQKHYQRDRSFRTTRKQARGGTHPIGNRPPKVSREKAIAFPETKPL